MNSKQEIFVAEYLTDRNSAAAARRAGYSIRRADRTGYDLLRKPEIAAAIAAADEERQTRLGFDADTLAQRLWEIHEKAFAGAPKVTRDGVPIVIVGEDGIGVPIMDWSPGGATRPIELLMKHLGMSGAEKHEISMPDGAPFVYTLTLDRELPGLEDEA